tara:strand:+ start:45 stop:593 length:549 start_codon:yes stop_codon:yes gene_type:complete
MWYLITYPIEKGLFSHLVEESCLEEHNKYIKEKYDAEPSWSKEIDKVRIDPGGIMLSNSEPSLIDLPDGSTAEINNEHILSVIDYYFSMDILADASDRIMNTPEEDKGYTVRVLKEDIIKVYQPYIILVMRADVYMHIATRIEKLYLKGLHAFYDMASILPDEFFIETMMLDALLSGEMAEA